jgi:hypothetical protein
MKNCPCLYHLSHRFVLTVIDLTRRLTSKWENASHEPNSHHFVLDCRNCPSWRTVAACAHGNSGGPADPRQTGVNRPKKTVSHTEGWPQACLSARHQLLRGCLRSNPRLPAGRGARNIPGNPALEAFHGRAAGVTGTLHREMSPCADSSERDSLTAFP